MGGWFLSQDPVKRWEHCHRDLYHLSENKYNLSGIHIILQHPGSSIFPVTYDKSGHAGWNYWGLNSIFLCKSDCILGKKLHLTIEPCVPEIMIFFWKIMSTVQFLALILVLNSTTIGANVWMASNNYEPGENLGNRHVGPHLRTAWFWPPVVFLATHFGFSTLQLCDEPFLWVSLQLTLWCLMVVNG